MPIEEGGAAVTTEVPAAVSGSTASTGAAGSGTPPPVSKWEDDPRAKGMLSDLQKERRARQQYEQRQTELQSELNEWKRKTEALVGSRSPSKDEADEQAVKDRFKQLYPHLADLTAEDVEAIREAKSQGAQTNSFIEQQWTNHHSNMLKDVHEGIAKEMGDLTPRQIARINAAYVREAESNPEFMSKLEHGDKTATAQFVKEYLEDFVAPVQRKQNADNASRFRPVPNAKDRSMPLPGEKKIDPNDNDAVMKMLVESRKGKFGRQ